MRNFNTLGSCSKAGQPKNFVDPCCPWVKADGSTRQHTHMSTHRRRAVTARPVRGHFQRSLPTPLHHPLPFVITLVSSGLISWHLWISNCMWNVEIRGTGAGDKRRVKPTLKNHENVAAQYPVTPTLLFRLVYCQKWVDDTHINQEAEHIKMHVYTESHLAMMNTENS